MRNLWINLHLYLAAFLAPCLLVMAVSGGLYLIGITGTLSSTPVSVPAGTVIDLDSPSVEADVRALLRQLGIVHEFEYVRKSGNRLLTRPTSRTYYEIALAGDTLEVTRQVPDLQKCLIELHKGHGPLLFKDFQKILAVGVLCIVFSGLRLGLSSPGLRTRTIVTGLGGLALFVLLAFGV